MAVEEDGLDSRQQGVLPVEVSPPHLHHTQLGVGEMVDRLLKNGWGWYEIGVEDEDEIAQQLANLPSPENPSETAKTAEAVAKHMLWLAETPPGGPTGQIYSLMRRPI